MILVLADLTCPLQRKRIEILKNLKCKIFLLHNATGEQLSDEVKKYYYNYNFIIFEQPKIKNKHIRYICSMFYTFYIIIKYKPELIIIHWASRLYQTLALYPFLSRSITTVMGSEIMPNGETSYFLKRIFINILIKNSNIITVKSSYMKNILINNFNIEPNKIEIITFGVHPMFFNITKDEFLIKKFNLYNKKVFFSVRSLKNFYKIKEIVEAFIEFKKKTGSNSVLIVSRMFEEKDYYEQIKEIAKLSKFNNDIIFVEQIPYEKMPNFLSISDALVSFVDSDGLPHTMLEGIAAKKFLIYRDLPQYEGFLFHKKNAFLVKNLNELIEAFIYVENNNYLDVKINFNEKLNNLLSYKYQKQKYLALCKQILEK